MRRQDGCGGGTNAEAGRRQRRDGGGGGTEAVAMMDPEAVSMMEGGVN